MFLGELVEVRNLDTSRSHRSDKLRKLTSGCCPVPYVFSWGSIPDRKRYLRRLSKVEREERFDQLLLQSAPEPLCVNLSLLSVQIERLYFSGGSVRPGGRHFGP